MPIYSGLLRFELEQECDPFPRDSGLRIACPQTLFVNEVKADMPISIESAEAEEKLPRKEKIAYGLTAIPNEIAINALKHLGMPIFNITLHLSPTLVGTVFMLIRLWDAVTDPVFGWISDNTRSRWGRRRPFIVGGGIACAITFPLILFVPGGLGENGIFWYFLIFALLHYSAVTVLQVSTDSFGYELSSSYTERTNVFAYRSFFAQISLFIMPWLFYLCQLDIFGGTMRGARFVGVGVGVICLALMLPAVFFCREGYRERAKKQEKVGIGFSIRATLRNKPFVRLVVIVVATIFGTNFTVAFGTYVSIYYVADGDQKFGSLLHGISTSAGVAVSLLAIPVLSRISRKIGKTRTMMVCLGSLSFGSMLAFFVYTPSYPYLQILAHPFIFIGHIGFWMLLFSMRADVCDWDEWKTGYRREGMYAAASGWFQKLTQALTFGVAAGGILSVIGFDAAKGAAQEESTLLALRLIFSIVPMAFGIFGIFVLRGYPITQELAEKISLELRIRNCENERASHVED